MATDDVEIAQDDGDCDGSDERRGTAFQVSRVGCESAGTSCDAKAPTAGIIFRSNLPEDLAVRLTTTRY
jgi:hypothetical protein